MRIVGCDFSSKAIDLVAIDLDDLEPPQWTRYELHGQDAFDRTRQIASVMPKRGSIWWADVLAVGIEHPAGKFGTGSMMRVQGAVLACLPAGVLVQPWPPSAWRKAVGLKGNASKEDVQDWVISKTGGEYGLASLWPFDACDAYCLALATRNALAQVESEAA